VDDDTELREVLAMLLEGMGYDVLAVQSGREALKLLVKDEIDLILIDMIMPEMGGYDFLVATEGLKTPPIIVCSGVRSPKLPRQVPVCPKNGCIDVLIRFVHEAIGPVTEIADETVSPAPG